MSSHSSNCSNFLVYIITFRPSKAYASYICTFSTNSKVETTNNSMDWCYILTMPISHVSKTLLCRCFLPRTYVVRFCFVCPKKSFLNTFGTLPYITLNICCPLDATDKVKRYILIMTFNMVMLKQLPFATMTELFKHYGSVSIAFKSQNIIAELT